jgi:hypothetical protein
MIFPANSRYQGTATAKLERADGSEVVYLRRRFLPQPERLVLLTEHVVVEGDRIDNVAARYLGDPEQFWRVADANRAMRPDALLDSVGRRLRITLPDGVPGAPVV